MQKDSLKINYVTGDFMIYFWIILALILGFLALVLYSPLKINVEYRNAKMRLQFRCLFIKISIDDSRFKNKKNDKAELADRKNSVGAFDRIKNFRSGYENVKDILGEILDLVKNRAEFSGIFIRVKYGTGDAAITGMVYGAIWGLVGNIYAFLCRFFKIQFPTLELEPVFGSKAFEIEAEGIIETRLVHIITAVLRSAKLYFKHKKKKGED
jgi:hypothetical protein